MIKYGNFLSNTSIALIAIFQILLSWSEKIEERYKGKVPEPLKYKIAKWVINSDIVVYCIIVVIFIIGLILDFIKIKMSDV